MPGSGGRVGRGIYLADEAGKSGWYCRPSAEGIGVMFLAEAELGRVCEIASEQPRLTAPPAAFDSVIARGKSCPDPAGDVAVALPGGAAATLATGAPRRVAGDDKSTFSQTEYLLYEERRVRLRYLVTVKMP